MANNTTMDLTDLDTPAIFRGGSGCIGCGVSPDFAEFLWDVFSTLWCMGCYKQIFSVQLARGLFCHQRALVIPSVSSILIYDLEKNAKVTWSSVADETVLPVETVGYCNGQYHSVYAKMWEYQDGTRLSTAHLRDGRFVAAGKRLPAHSLDCRTTPRSTQVETCDKMIQTKDVCWFWNEDDGEITEISHMANTTECPPLPGGKAMRHVGNQQENLPVLPVVLAKIPDEDSPADLDKMADAVERLLGDLQESVSSRVPGVEQSVATPFQDEYMKVEGPAEIIERMDFQHWQGDVLPSNLSPVPPVSDDLRDIRDEENTGLFCPCNDLSLF